MRIVDGDAIQKSAIRQNRVPGFFQAGHPTSTNVVDLRVTVEYLEQPVVADLPQLVGGNGPAKRRVIDVRDSVRPPDGVHVSL